MLTLDRQEVSSGDDKTAFHNFQICGKEVPRGYWVGTLLILFFILLKFAFSTFVEFWIFLYNRFMNFLHLVSVDVF